MRRNSVTLSASGKSCAEHDHAYNVDRSQALRARLDELKLAAGCADCGYKGHPHALEFDHLPGSVKCFSIGTKLASFGTERVMAEIAKCEVVCANCHRIRTAERRKRGV